MRNLLILAAACGLAACAKSGPPTVQALDPWCRPAPAGALSAACYLTLTSNGDDRLVSVASPAADKVEVHTMDMTGGIMRMGPLTDGLKLPRNKAVALTPGAEHVMLIGPKAEVAVGTSVSLTLTFDKAPPLMVTAPVRPAVLPGG